jgi:antitoxin (DNA-binding transcriptional repressor) of toxin-antitoxin stability system
MLNHMRANRVVNVTEFKAKCLSFFSEVESGVVSITVTRRGKVVGVVNPPPARKYKSLKDSWAGRIKEIGDIAKTDGAAAWDVVNGRPWPK